MAGSRTEWQKRHVTEVSEGSGRADCERCEKNVKGRGQGQVKS